MLEAVRCQTTGLQPERVQAPSGGQRGRQLSKTAIINFLCQERVTGNVQDTESGERREDSP